MTGIAGHCEADRTCTCNAGYGRNPLTGRCMVALPTCPPGAFFQCSDPMSAAAMGYCSTTNTCVCLTGFVITAGGHCGLPPASVCTIGAVGSCNDDPAMAAIGGTCGPLAGGLGCACSDGFDTNPLTGRCRGAGFTGGIVSYSWRWLATGLARLQVLRDDQAAGHCALLTLVSPAPPSSPSLNVSVQGRPPGGGAGSWGVERVEYAQSRCATIVSNPGTPRTDAAWVQGSVVFFTGSTMHIGLHVEALFQPGVGGAPPPGAMRFLASDLR